MRTLEGFVTADSSMSDSAEVETDTEEPESEAASDTIVTTVPKSGVRGAAAKRSRFESPRWVMIRSGVLPGWGQWHNGSWLKAALVAAGEVGMGLRIVGERSTLDRLNTQVEAARDAGDDDLEAALIEDYNTRLDTYTGRQWLLGAVIAYSLLDAYIDAHFRDFKIEFQEDPALPNGKAPETQVRVGLRFGF